ncbi:MAG: hypothetical protein GXP42_12015 [Chloroflexi bacterium]|nr:hypothetical protein [Chloroflexota bacterium]
MGVRIASDLWRDAWERARIITEQTVAAANGCGQATAEWTVKVTSAESRIYLPLTLESHAASPTPTPTPTTTPQVFRLQRFSDAGG